MLTFARHILRATEGAVRVWYRSRLGEDNAFVYRGQNL
jgi:hypothetical protein